MYTAMDNSQAIHWFAGFFEGEGCFSLRKIKSSKIDTFYLGPKVSISSTNIKAIELCQKTLTDWYINYTTSVSIRTGRISCYDICVNKVESVIWLTNKLRPLLECDSERNRIMNRFCESRSNSKYASPVTESQWQLYSEFYQWRASETTRGTPYEHSLDWLAGAYESEGNFNIHSNGSPSIQFCNTNTSMAWKVYDHLDEMNLGPHIKRFETGKIQHQPFWHVTLHGKTKCKRFALDMLPYFRVRRQELQRVMI